MRWPSRLDLHCRDALGARAGCYDPRHGLGLRPKSRVGLDGFQPLSRVLRRQDREAPLEPGRLSALPAIHGATTVLATTSLRSAETIPASALDTVATLDQERQPVPLRFGQRRPFGDHVLDEVLDPLGAQVAVDLSGVPASCHGRAARPEEATCLGGDVEPMSPNWM